MKTCTGIVFLILLWMLLPMTARAQPELGMDNRSAKEVSEARNIAFTNTGLPLVTGLGAAYLFKGDKLTTAGAALAMSGLLIGPSTGNFYAEDYARGGLGILARLGSGVVLVKATQELFGNEVARSLGWDEGSVELTDTDILIGTGIFVGSMVYNFISAKASVEQYNSKRGYNMEVNPGVRQRRGRWVPTISARIQF